MTSGKNGTMLAVWVASVLVGVAMAAPAEMPAGLGQAVEQARYRIREQKEGKGYQSFNPAQDSRAAFTETGMSVRPGSAKDTWRWGLELRSYGYGQRQRPVGAATPVASGNRIEYRRGPLTEWYVNGKRGIEQGFRVQEPPGKPGAHDWLELHLGVAGGLMARVNSSGDEVSFVNAEGRAVLRYSELMAFDRTGRRLAAHMRAEVGEVRLAVEDKGAVYPITIDPLVATQTILLPGNPSAGAIFGSSVAIDGDTAVVGAANDSTVASRAGSAYIFVRNGTTWSEQANLLPSDAAANNQFGTSAAISGDTAVIGTSAGLAYVFVRSGTAWSQQARLVSSDAASGYDAFGYSVAISGSTIIIGAPSYDIETGAAHIYTLSGTNWVEQARLASSGGQFGDEFGQAVAIDGGTVVVGVPGRNSLTGEAYVYVLSGTAWSNQAVLTALDGVSLDEFGLSMAISGDTVVAGAPSHSPNGLPRAGAAYIFLRSGTIWSQQEELIASDGAQAALLGFAVAIDGNNAVVGAPRASTPAGSSTGAAYLFTSDGTTWTQQVKVVASDAAPNDLLGQSAGISGNALIVGSIYHATTGGASAGESYIYNFGNPVTIASTPSGLAFTVTGNSCQAGSYTTPQTLTWNASCVVTFASPLAAGSGTQQVFSAWADGPTDLPRTIAVPTAPITYTANFNLQYQLTTLVSPAGAGNVTGGNAFYTANSNAPITATANAGYQFGNWTGSVAQPNSSSSTVSMTAPQTVTANFQLIPTVTLANASGQATSNVILNATVGPPGQAFTGQLQFQVAGANVGAPSTVTGSGNYNVSYTISQGAGQYPISAVFTSTSPLAVSVTASGATLTVTLAPQSITWPTIAPQLAGAQVALSATAPGGTVTFSATASDTGICTVSGNTATMTGAGSCTITASQAGNSIYAPATVSQTFTVNPQTQTISWATIPTQVVVAHVALSATAPGGPVIFAPTASDAGVCTVSGNTATMTGAGNCTISASQAGNAIYSPVSTAQTFSVNRQTQTITWTSIGQQLVGAQVALSATAPGGPVTFTATASDTGICTVSGNTASMTGLGSCTITASQAGNATYSPATVSQTFAVNQQTQTITWPPIGPQLVGAQVVLSATAPGGPVTFAAAASDTGICTVSGNTATMTGAGSCTITASQAGNTIYVPTSAKQSFLVTLPPPDFLISEILPTITISPGTTTEFFLDLLPENNFNGTVSLSCSGGPPGATCRGLPQSVKVNGVTLAVPGILFPVNTKSGTYTMTFTGVSGSLTHSTTGTFIVK